MVRSIGIDPGDSAVKVVQLDGSYRKTRLLSARVEQLPAVAADDKDRAEQVAAAARAAVDEGLKGDITLGHPCREAVLRTLELPFKGYEAIKKVVKAEIEGEIYLHAVDDMVVDFHEIGETAAGGTRLLVASVPKAGLGAQLHALAAQGIEPEVVDLDTMALWRVAHWAGAFAPAEGQPAPAATAVVDVGARSVKVILVQGEQLVEMRALRLGDAVVAEQLARAGELPLDVARAACLACLSSGQDQECDVPAADLPAIPGDEAEPGSLPVSAARRVVVSHADVEAQQAAWLQRLARELARFLTASAVAPKLEALWVTGGASRNAAVLEMLRAVFDREPRELDLLGRMQHDLDAGQVADLGPRLATAIGLALGPLGGPEGLQLRQENLALVRGFERIKFPLAITGLVALLALFVYGNAKQTELRLLEVQIGQEHIPKENPRAVVFHGMLNHMFFSKWFENPQFFRLERTGRKDYTHKDLLEEVLAEPVHGRLRLVRDRLRAVAEQKQKESGVYEEVSLESGFAVLVRWAEIMKRVEPDLGRYLVPKIDLNMKAPNRRLEFTIAFRGDDFRARMGVLARAIEADYQQPDSPFDPPQRSGEDVKESLFTDAEEKGVRGAYYRVSIRVKSSFPPFGPSASPAIGSAAPARPVTPDMLAAVDRRDDDSTEEGGR